jgi:hypothetical protein
MPKKELKFRMFRDGHELSVLLGPSVEEGVEGRGATVSEALDDFKHALCQYGDDFDELVAALPEYGVRVK